MCRNVKSNAFPWGRGKNLLKTHEKPSITMEFQSNFNLRCFLFLCCPKKERKFMKNPPTMRNSVEYIECTNILVTYFFFTLHFSHFIPPKWAIIWNRMQCYKNFNTSVVEIIMNTSKIFFQSNNKLMAFVGMLKVNCSLKCILWARKCQCVCIKRNVRLSTLVGLFFLHFGFYAP